MGRPFLLVPRPGVTPEDIDDVIGRLPPSVTANMDLEVNVLVVDWAPHADAADRNATVSVLSESMLFFVGPGSEAAARRYLPSTGSPSGWAAWDVNGDEWRGICERCGWGTSAASRGALYDEMDRHDQEVHGDE